MEQKSWHAMDAEAALAALEVDGCTGLSSQQAAHRLERVGPNRLVERRRVSAWKILQQQFQDFMVMVLLAATAISYFLGEVSDAITIVAIVVLNAILGFIQEFRAERSLEALKAMTAPKARVLRDGEPKEIAAEELVPGDILLLESGDRIAADGRLLETANLEVEESALTGESLPVRKRTAALDASDAPLGDRRNMVYLGTVATRGRGHAVVVNTGMETEMGRIAGMIQEAVESETPLQRRLDHLGKVMVGVSLAVCALVVVAGVLREEPVLQMFMAGVSLAVAAIPEGLPAIVTVALALGVQRMIKGNAIVRKLPAVETLGCATVICSDKTGTLTKNEMTVKAIYTGGSWYSVSGDGYNPWGRFTRDGKDSHSGTDPQLRLALLTGAVCNNSKLIKAERPRRGLRGLAGLAWRSSEEWQVQGDPTEGALLVAAAKAGLDREAQGREHVRVAEIPFESERRCMTVVTRGSKGNFTAHVKGAPDTILELCNHVYAEGRARPLDDQTREAILRASDEMAGQALRVLAVAVRHLDALAADVTPEAVERGLTFVGLQGMIDPPRPEAVRALEKCHTAGLKAVMITGDHKATAVAIARQLSLLPPGGGALTGRELDAMDDQQLAQVVDGTYVYARVSPQHKLRIVRALKARGHIVAMTGDGVNDAPAVKEADIGVAMGKSGTDVTKEASAMVLADDNFATIVRAVEEGRSIYDNIRKFIRYLLSCNIGEVLVMLIAAVVGLPLPLLPIQILWVNLVTDGLPAMALGVDPAEPDVMRRPPRQPNESVFSRGLGRKIAIRGVMIGVLVLGLFTYDLYRFGDLTHARTMAFAALVMSQLFHVFDARSERRTLFEVGLFSNPYVIGAVSISTAMLLLVIYHTGLSAVFQTAPLDVADWTLVVLFSGAAQIAIWLRRFLFIQPRARARRRAAEWEGRRAA
ncbi:MAG: calcium-translocating P-type ATPase, SERCA-type [Symbiobacteriia bacterium]